MIKKIVSLISILSLAACGGSGSSGGASTDGGTSGAGGSLSDLATATKWQTSCLQGTSIQYGSQVVVSGNTLVLTTAYYNDASSCGTIYKVERATFTAATDGTSASNTSATSLNLTLTKLEYMPASASAQSDMNTGVDCGLSSWTAGSYKDVTATGCNTYSSTLYTIFAITGGSTLALGQQSGGNNGSSSSLRHTQLNSSTFAKQ
ncbi:MAG: hypothetical protein HUU57_10315 [Bdellovibrio sp.]|nr:hypothetical protein [Bdellovibrio sp.]